MILDGIRQDAIAAVRKTSGDVTGESGGRDSLIEVIQTLVQEAGQIGSVLQERSALLERHMELLRRANDHLWLDPDEANAAQQLLLPKAELFFAAVEQAREDAALLEEVLIAGGDASNDVRLSVIELLWDNERDLKVTFSEDALAMSMREAKAKYDSETFRQWKRSRKKAGAS